MGVNNGSRARMYLHFLFTPARSGGASGRLFAKRAHARAAQVTLPTDIIVVAEDAQRSSPLPPSEDRPFRGCLGAHAISPIPSRSRRCSHVLFRRRSRFRLCVPRPLTRRLWTDT